MLIAGSIRVGGNHPKLARPPGGPRGACRAVAPGASVLLSYPTFASTSDPCRAIACPKTESAPSAESCIRKAVAERGLTPGLVGLADAKAEDEPRARPGYGICKQRLDRRARRPGGSPETEERQGSRRSAVAAPEQRQESAQGADRPGHRAASGPGHGESWATSEVVATLTDYMMPRLERTRYGGRRTLPDDSTRTTGSG